MFPNIRLLIGTLLIALLVLSGEFGVFAALRVNREPLSRLTSESAPLQLVAGKNAPRPVPISWSAPLNVQPPAIDAQTGVAIVAVPAAQPAERAIQTAAPSNDATADTLNNDSQTSAAVVQAALAPSPAAPAPAVAPVPDAPAPIAQAPTPDNTPAPGHEKAAPNLDAIGAIAGNAAPEQTAAVPAQVAAVAVQQMPAAAIVKPAEAEPPQGAPAPQAHDTAAQSSEPQAGSAPVVAAIAPAAAEPAAQPAEVTGSVPNAAMPEAAAPKAAAPQAKPLPKIVHKPAAKKPHKVARAPALPHHPVKKRIARRARTPAAASSAQTASTFENPVFQSAPQIQRQTKSRPGARKAETNNSFNTFGTQFSTQ